MHSCKYMRKHCKHHIVCRWSAGNCSCNLYFIFPLFQYHILIPLCVCGKSTQLSYQKRKYLPNSKRFVCALLTLDLALALALAMQFGLTITRNRIQAVSKWESHATEHFGCKYVWTAWYAHSFFAGTKCQAQQNMLEESKTHY